MAKKKNKRENDMTTDMGKAKKQVVVSPNDFKSTSLSVFDVSNRYGLASQAIFAKEADLSNSPTGYVVVAKPIKVREKPRKGCVKNDDQLEQISFSQKQRVEDIGYSKGLQNNSILRDGKCQNGLEELEV